MRKFMMLAIAGVLVLAGGLAWAQKTALSPRRPTPVIQSLSRADSPIPMSPAPSLITATPATITFTANQPGTGTPVAGSSSATATWKLTTGATNNTWTLSVYANSTTFTGCTTVPASAVGVSCSSASGTGTGASASCQSGGPFTLPTTAPGQQVASGYEGTAGPSGSSSTFTVVLNYQFTDSWQYTANTSCPLTITYNVNAP
ncbi:MAG: hypothetical protein ABSE93_17015 [Terriglobia bacterium]|jgi:hypothetical protein